MMNHSYLGVTLWLILKTGSFLHQHHWVALHSSLLGPAFSSDKNCDLDNKTKILEALYLVL
jgi:hypothetical protein